MQGRRQSESFKIFEWSMGPRLMTVVRGIPMYQSSGENSGYKATWFPHLGIDGTRWIRKPRSLLPEEILAYCKQNELDKKITLSRFGTTQSICLSASIGGGFWITAYGLSLSLFLQDKYADYFLTDKELAAFQKAVKKRHRKTKDIAAANAYLEECGSWIPVNFRSRLPSAEEYSFFLMTNNPEIHSALSMMLVRKNMIDASTYKMVCTLSEMDGLLDYALRSGIFDICENIEILKKKLLMENKSLELNDLIRLNPFHHILLPLKYHHFQNKYTCRKVMRRLPDHIFPECDLYLMKKLDDLHLLDRYAELFIDTDSRRWLFFLEKEKKLNYRTLRALWKIYKRTEKIAENHFECESLPNDSNTNIHLYQGNGLFAAKNQGEIKQIEKDSPEKNPDMSYR